MEGVLILARIFVFSRRLAVKFTKKSVLAIAGAVALMAGAAVPAQAASYVAHLYPMNTTITGNQSTTGEAQFTEKGGQLTIDIRVKGAPANMEHWQHFHGFKTGDKKATCPTLAQDVNHDGVIDLIETGPTSGTTMVPFIKHPATMDVAHGAYPKANAKGDYHYHDTVSIKELQAAFAKAFPGQQLDLDKRVVFIHGVPRTTQLPSTVASLGPIPAQVTVPIACGVIDRVK